MTGNGDSGATHGDGGSADTSDAAASAIEELLFSCMAADDVDDAVARACSDHPQYAKKLRAVWARMQGLGLSPGRPEPERPTQLGPFRILEKLGEGGMGVVYLCEQTHPRRTVAVKVVRPELLHFEGKRARFEREIAATARLAHPSIVPILEVGVEGAVPWYSMEYVRGASLSQVLAALKRETQVGDAGSQPATAKDVARLDGAALLEALLASMRPEDFAALDIDRARSQAIFAGSYCDAILSILTQVTEAIEHAHAHGVLHRDIKPSNIMLLPDGRALLLDFGLARAEEGGEAQVLTRSTTSLGSLPFMPPEVLRGAVTDERSDVYALGVTLYEALTLRHPFLTSTAEATRARVLEGRAAHVRSINAAVPWDLDTVCRVAMAPEHARRYADATALREDLGRLGARLPIFARRPGALLRLRRWQQRHPATAVFAATMVGVLLVTSILMYVNERKSRIAESRLRARAERSLYISQVSQAMSAIAMDNYNQARSALDACDVEQRGLLWKNLRMRTDSASQTWTFGKVGFTRHAIAPDERSIVVASTPKTLRILPLLLLDGRASIDTTLPTITLSEDAHCLSISSDSKTLLVTPHSGAWVDVFDMASRALLRRIECDDSSGFMAQFLADDASFVSFADDGRCVVRRLDDAAVLREWQGLEADRHVSRELLLDAARKKIACASESGRVAVFDDAGSQLCAFAVQGRNIDSMAFSHDTKSLFVGSYDIRASQMYVAQYRLEDGEKLRNYEVLSTPSSIALPPRSPWIVILAATVQVHDVESARRLRTLNGPRRQTEITSFDSRGAMWTSSDDGVVRRWSLTEPAYESTLAGNEHSITALGIAHAGATIVAADKSGTLVISRVDEDRSQAIDLHEERAIAVHTSEDPASEVARVVHRDGSLFAVEYASGKVRSQHSVAPEIVTAAWTEDALLTAHTDKALRLWSIDGDREIGQARSFEHAILKIATRGSRVAVASGAKLTFLTSTAGGLGSWLADIECEAPITAIDFDRQAKKLAVAIEGFRIIVIDLETRARIYEGGDSAGRFSAVAFAPDDSTLVACNWASQVWFIDFRHGQEIGHFFLGTMPLCLAMSPDGRYLATGNINRHVHLAWFERRP